MPLRVLTISKPYVAAAYRDKLSLLARDKDLDIGLICPTVWGSQQFEERSSSEDHFWLRKIPVHLSGRNHFHFYAQGLRQAIQEFRPDILNVEEEHYSLVTLQCLLAARGSGSKLVFYTWQNIYKKYPPPFAWIEALVFKTASAAVTGIAEATAVLRSKAYQGHIEQIPQMGVNLVMFAPAKSKEDTKREKRRQLGLDQEAFWLGFVGRLVLEKDISTLLQAFCGLQEAGLPKSRLLILGSGPCLDELQREARELGIAELVTWQTEVKSTAVSDYLQALDVLCLPSKTQRNWKEQFGRILIEAMAAEACVVGSSSGEIPLVIADAGLIFQEGSVGELRAQLLRLLRTPELRRNLQARGAERVRALYTNQQVAAHWARLFKQLGALGSS